MFVRGECGYSTRKNGVPAAQQSSKGAEVGTENERHRGNERDGRSAARRHQHAMKAKSSRKREDG